MAKLVLFVWIMVLLCNLFYHLLLMLFFSLLDNITEKICLCALLFRFFIYNTYFLIVFLPMFEALSYKIIAKVFFEGRFRGF